MKIFFFCQLHKFLKIYIFKLSKNAWLAMTMTIKYVNTHEHTAHPEILTFRISSSALRSLWCIAFFCQFVLAASSGSLGTVISSKFTKMALWALRARFGPIRFSLVSKCGLFPSLHIFQGSKVIEKVWIQRTRCVHISYKISQWKGFSCWMSFQHFTLTLFTMMLM